MHTWVSSLTGQRRRAVATVGAVLGAAVLVASVPTPERSPAPAFVGAQGLPSLSIEVVGVSYPGPTSLGPGEVAAPPVSLPLVQPPAATAAVAAGAVGALGIPDVAVAAYRGAADRLAKDQPGCHVPWTLIAGIGRVESDHARGGRVDAAGRTVPLILGPVLDGSLAGNAAVRDTDQGRFDQDPVWDRAVGPMQFLPGTWARWGADGSGDGVADPHNIRDAALGTGRYLCSGGGDLSQDGPARSAVFSYNHSDAYVDTVLAWAHAYATGAVTIPALPAAPTTTAAPAPARSAPAAPAPPTTDPAPSTDPTTPVPASTTDPAPSTTPSPTTDPVPSTPPSSSPVVPPSS